MTEVAISVEFVPLPKWKSSHAGLYWSQINKTYPQTQVHPPLVSVPEKIGDDIWRRPQVHVSVFDPESSRFWFISASGDSLIQVQRDRFIVNWRRMRDDDTYPTYHKVLRQRFLEEWKRFKKFIFDNELGEFDVRRAELTYVNDIPRGNGWATIEELLQLFSSLWKQPQSGFLPSPETLTATGSFLMPEQKGRLHFATQLVRRQSDEKEAYQLQLIARGDPPGSSDDAVMSWIDLGHEWIVRGFVDLTSKRAHDLWGRKV